MNKLRYNHKIGGRGRGIGIQFVGVNSHNKRELLCAALVDSLSAYNERGASNQMKTTLKKSVKHTSTIYGLDISNELHNRKEVSIDKPQHTQAVLDRHQDMMALRVNVLMRLQAARSYK